MNDAAMVAPSGPKDPQRRPAAKMDQKHTNRPHPPGQSATAHLPGEPPAPEAVLKAFAELQQQLAHTFQKIFEDPNSPKTVVILPSLSLDQEIMAKIAGVHHYEERMLCLLLLLRMPRTRVIYLTSTPIHEMIIDYYLHLLPGVPAQHARSRLTLLACDDPSPIALTRKILERPRLMDRIRQAIPDASVAHMTCFTVTGLERALAVELGLPLYGCDPALLDWGSKSGSRRIFREAGIDMPDGFEDLKNADDIASAITELKTRSPALEKAVIKINEGFSGEGNAVIDLENAPEGENLRPWVQDHLPSIAFEAGGMSWDLYEKKFGAMGGIVEAFIPGTDKRSPSAQFRVNPNGELTAISTHDQVLGGENQQIFVGCRFPADEQYRLTIQHTGMKAARLLADKGILGRFGIDFISTRDGNGWRHQAIEINLRKGGTTHPFQMLQFLTDGRYDPETGQYLTVAGQPRCYYASDNLESERYRGLTPYDLVDISVMNGLHFHSATGEGVTFHLIGALSEFGKLGVVCIGETPDRAETFYQRTVEILNAEGGQDYNKS